MLDVVPDRLGRDPQPRRDVLVRQAPGDQPQHVHLAFGEPCRAGDLWRAGGLSRRGKHGGDLGPTEATGIDLIQEARSGSCGVQRGTVRPLLAHRVIGVRRDQQPRGERQPFA